ncbi:trypsin-like peptidase domain-containing protein [Streptomyces sp. ALI-76-A]|uniref:S1C family serine protease n=1 Tax=Streptomyces sp. ALI-76-A TaxID=3025736 RepID=UPI00256EDD63|nr:trypsin-like peptidase domain-containing protein [Streptomyces sp. ALI-76-A]MDL5203644.1 trypsin-like peptidase domain-containing protein [Streptomyces sp. ALI-76-A]
MNEGKPAKADGPAPRPAPYEVPEVPEVPDVSADRWRGAGAAAHDADSEGDFALRAPDEAPGPAAESPAPAGGDFALPAPQAPAVPEGDYQLRDPEAAPDGRLRPGVAGGGTALAERPRPGAESETATAGQQWLRAGDETAPGDDQQAGASVAGGASGPVADRPRPLHDPDPYSTPPYGEPGPWAPAPPVQHPAGTPAEGTALPVPAPPPQGTPVAPPAPGTVAEPYAPAHAVQKPAPAPAPNPVPAPAPAAVSPPPPATVPMTATTPDSPSPFTPWQNYDPWAPVAAPLQQSGAGVVSREQRRRRVRTVAVGAAVLLALVSGGVGGVVGAYLERNGGMGNVELPQTAAEPAGRDADSVAGIAARALPSVVTLHVSGSEDQGTGTGFVLDDRGHILTNNHVVEPAGSDGRISVTFHSGDTSEATVVGRDSGYDLAVVKVKGVSGLKPLPLGNSDNVQVGDPVVAIGAPFDLAGTVTSGIISAKERPITAGGESGDASDVSYVDALQTDAPINPGNSGGPLLDAQARVIGINSAIRSADSGTAPEGGQAGSIGLGFAIPVNQGKRVAEELINTGRATHPVIGVTLDMDYDGDGARVGTKSGAGGPAVVVGGPGDRAGIRAGDVITEVDGRPVRSGEELIVKTRAHRPGDRLELTVQRDGEERTVSLVLGSSGD